MLQFADGQWVWGAVYSINIVFISCSLGFLFLSLKVFEKIPRFSAFCIGVSFTPLVIAIWMIGMSFVPAFYGKQYVTLFIPVIIAVLLIWYFLNKIEIKRIYISSCFENKIILLLALGIIILFLYKLLLGINVYMIDNDAGFYLAEALKFSRTLSYHDISSYKDSSNGVLNGSVHNFIWPAYISYGSICTEYHKMGSTYDLASMLSIRFTSLYLIIIIVGMLYTICERKKKNVVIGFFLIFLVGFFQNIIDAHSRDFFRVIPLILLWTMLYLISKRQVNHSVSFYIILIMIGLFVPSGHPINVITVGIIGGTWLVYEYILNHNLKGIFLTLLFLGIGFIIGIYNIIYAVIKTGTMSGYCSLYFDNVVRGTALEKVYFDYMYSTMNKGANIFECIKSIFISDIYKLNYICFILCFVFSGIIIYKKRKEFVFASALYIPLTYINTFLFLFVGKLISWGGGSYTEWLVRNPRYSFHYGIMSIITISYIFSYLGDNKFKKVVLYLTFSVSLIVLLKYDVLSISEFREQYYKETGCLLQEYLEERIDDKNILISESGYAYMTGLECKILLSYYGTELFQAESKEDVEKFFKKNNIGAVYLDSTYADIFLKGSYFYQYMLQLPSEQIVKEGNRAKVYQLNLK